MSTYDAAAIAAEAYLRPEAGTPVSHDHAHALLADAQMHADPMELAEAFRAHAVANGWTVEQATDPGLMVGWFSQAMGLADTRAREAAHAERATKVTLRRDDAEAVLSWVLSLPEWLRGNGRVFTAAERAHGVVEGSRPPRRAAGLIPPPF